MAETNNLQNDWVALNLLNDNVTIENLAANGINSTNTGIKPKEEYLKSKDIQEMFKNDSGNLDEKKFNESYDQMMQSYLAFSQIDQNDWIEKNYAVDPYDISRSADDVIDDGKKYVIHSVKNPFETSFGFHEGGEGLRTLSVAELAQKNPYYDTEKGEFSDKSPNDLGALGYLGKDALVLAQYDEDMTETLDDGSVIQHKKGDYKLNPDGKYYYETANGKETYNKQVLGAFDILTTDGSVWNKIDIFDTDNIKTSPVKSIARAIAINLPYIFSGFGEYYALASASMFLAESMPAIIKTFNGLINGDYEPSKGLNDYENWSKKIFNTTKSENARTHFFSFENIMNIAASSGSQLFQQRAVANIPKLLGFDKRLENKIGLLKSKAFDEAVKSNLITRQDVAEALKMAHAGKRMPERIEAIIDAMPEYKQAYDVYKKYMKQSEALSRAYLTITSASNVYGDAINDGFDRRTAGLISLGVYLGYDAFFRTDYMRRFLRSGIDLEEEGKLLRQSVYQNLVARGKDAFGEIAKEKGALGVLKESKNIFKKAWDEVQKGGRDYWFLAGVNESVEETMEELMMDASKAIFGNGLNAIREQLGYDTKGYFDYAKSDPLKRYVQSAIGGFIGGEIFGLESAWRSRNGSTSWNDMLSNRPELGRSILKYVNAGKKDDIIRLANSFRGTAFASKSLSYHERNDDGSYKATDKQNESQNDYVIDSFISYVNNLDRLLEQEGMKYDPENEQYKDVYRSLTALTLSERLFGAGSKYTDVVAEDISKLQVELYDVQSKILEANRNENKNEKEIELLTYQFNLIKKRISDLRSGTDENVFGMMLASANPSIFGDRSQANIQAFTKNKYDIDYDNIKDTDIKKLISEKYKQYISSGEAQHDSWLSYITYKNIQSKITEIFKVSSSSNKPWLNLSRIIRNPIDSASNGVLSLDGFVGPNQQITYKGILEAVMANNIKIRLLQVIENNAENYLDDNLDFILNEDGDLYDPENAIHQLTDDWGFNLEQIKSVISNVISAKSVGENVFEELNQEEILSLANLIAISINGTENSFIPSFKDNSVISNIVYNNFQRGRTSTNLTENNYYKHFLDSISILKNTYKDAYIAAMGEGSWDDNIFESIGLGDNINNPNIKTFYDQDIYDDEDTESNEVSSMTNIEKLFKELGFGDLSTVNIFWKLLLQDPLSFTLEPADSIKLKKIKENLELLETFLNGTVDSSRSTYNLMGGNSVINQFRTENNSVEPQLLTMSENSKILYEYSVRILTDKIDQLIDAAEKNSVNENNREKKLGLKIKSENLDFLSKIYITFKDIYDDFPEMSKIEPNQTSSDVEVEEEDIRLENILVKYECDLYNWFNNKDEQVKKDFISKLQSIFPDYAKEASFLSLNDKENSIGDYTEDARAYWYIISNCLYNPATFYTSLKEIINNNKISKAPYYSQEVLAKTAFLFTFGNQSDLRLILEQSKEDLGNNFGLVALGENILRFSAGNGVGKTAAIIPMIRALVDNHSLATNISKKILYISTTEKAINKLSSEQSEKKTMAAFLEQLDKYVTIYDSEDKEILSGSVLEKLSLLNPYNESETQILDFNYIKNSGNGGVAINPAIKVLLKDKLIIIDEGTYIDTRIYGLLSYANKLYGLNLKIITTGDSLQGGLDQNFTSVLSMLAPSLYESKRVTTNVGKHNNNQLRDYVLKGENNIQFNYSVNSENGEFSGEEFVGVMALRQIELSKAQLLINHNKNKYILAYGNIPGLTGDNVQVANNIKDIQGDEFDYIIVKASDLSGMTRKDVNTLLSRYKNGAIIINDQSIFHDSTGASFTVNKINWEDVISIGVANEENISKYIEYRKRTLNDLSIPEIQKTSNIGEIISDLEEVVEELELNSQNESQINEGDQLNHTENEVSQPESNVEEISSEEAITEDIDQSESSQIEESNDVNFDDDRIEKLRELMRARISSILGTFNSGDEYYSKIVEDLNRLLEVIDNADFDQLDEINIILGDIQKEFISLVRSRTEETSTNILPNGFSEEIEIEPEVVSVVPFDETKKYKLRMYSFYNRLGGIIEEGMYSSSGDHLNEDLNIFLNQQYDFVDISSDDFIDAQESLHIERNILLYNLSNKRNKKELNKLSEYGEYIIKVSRFDPFSDSLFDKGNENEYKLLKKGDLFRRLIYKDKTGKEITLLIFPNENTVKSHAKDNIKLIKYINELTLSESENEAYYEINFDYISFRENDRPIYFEKYNPDLVQSNPTWHQFEPFKRDGQYSWMKYTDPLVFGKNFFTETEFFNGKTIVEIWDDLDELYEKAAIYFDSANIDNIENPFKYKSGSTVKCSRIIKKGDNIDTFPPVIFAYLNIGETIPTRKALGIYINTLKSHYEKMQNLIEYVERERNTGELLNPIKFLEAASMKYDVVPLTIARNIKNEDELSKIFSNFVSELGRDNSEDKDIRSSTINSICSLLNVLHRKAFDQHQDTEDEYLNAIQPIFESLRPFGINESNYNILSKKVGDITDSIRNNESIPLTIDISGNEIKILDLIKIIFNELYNNQGLLKPQFMKIFNKRNIFTGRVTIGDKKVSVRSLPLLYPTLFSRIEIANFQKDSSSPYSIDMRRDGEREKYVFNGPYILERGWTFMEYDIPIVNDNEDFNSVIKKKNNKQNGIQQPVTSEGNVVIIGDVDFGDLTTINERNKDSERSFNELEDFYEILDIIDDNHDELGYNWYTFIEMVNSILTSSDDTRYSSENLEDILNNDALTQDVIARLEEIGVNLQNLIDLLDSNEIYISDTDLIKYAWEYENKIKCLK